jgi:hypothetical protein
MNLWIRGAKCQTLHNCLTHMNFATRCITSTHHMYTKHAQQTSTVLHRRLDLASCCLADSRHPKPLLALAMSSAQQPGLRAALSQFAPASLSAHSLNARSRPGKALSAAEAREEPRIMMASGMSYEVPMCSNDTLMTSQMCERGRGALEGIACLQPQSYCP